MSFTDAIRAVVSLELRQRVRAKSWYILLGVYVAIVAAISILLLVALPAFGWAGGGGVLSTIVYFVLLLGTLVTPALSGNAVNGDRAEGTLATTQVTQVSSTALILGKFLAAWISALAFLAASVPFLALCFVVGGVTFDTLLVSLVVLVFELGVVAAVGVGLSALLTRPIFSIVVTYLVVAALSIGTLIVFVLAGIATQSTVTSTTRYQDYTGSNGESVCTQWETTTYTTPRFDPYWSILMANPYVFLADATPTQYDAQGNVEDLFGGIKVGARQAQIAPELDQRNDYCVATDEYSGSESAKQIVDSTVPGWFVGGLIHLLLGAGMLGLGIRATRTPARKLATGSRIA